MRSMKAIAALFVVFGMGSFAQAGLHKRGGDCGASKCCDCAPTFQPSNCKPTIVRPCHRNVYNYQRSCAKATGCDTGCGPANSCAPCGAGNGCTNGAGNCAAPCGVGAGCGAGAGNCAAPCGTGNACAAGAGNCAAPCGAGDACAAGAGNCAPCAGNGDACCATTCEDACEIAQLIYTSQTACYARQRKAALHKLGRHYDCVCNPEIMSAFIYGLNDCDENVRAAAADEIGDELRKNSCCCSACVVSALTSALADCDRGVRRQAEQGLKQCGYDIVDPTCCEVACDNGCVGGNCAAVAPVPSPSEMVPAAVPNAPAPPSEPKAYFPKRIKDEHARPISKSKKSLNNMFGMMN